ncbi:MAG: MBL fold metallo-hydrolase [Clostridium sp.]|nr:MBL fold metallo-hydrolase [Clostridium sp.]
MTIKWLGHSCFLLTSQEGTRIVTDPFDETVGYRVEAIEAEIVSTSHEHYDHNNISIIKGDAKHIKGAGKVRIGDIEVTSVESFHDECKGKKRGKNYIFKFGIDNINICHLGDLGHVLNRKQLEEIGKVDILLVPVGGIYTIDYNEAYEVVELIGPSVVIPMHYKTPALSFELDSADKFLEKMGKWEHTNKQEIMLTKDKIGRDRQVLVLNYTQ